MTSCCPSESAQQCAQPSPPNARLGSGGTRGRLPSTLRIRAASPGWPVGREGAARRPKQLVGLATEKPSGLAGRHWPPAPSFSRLVYPSCAFFRRRGVSRRRGVAPGSPAAAAAAAAARSRRWNSPRVFRSVARSVSPSGAPPSPGRARATAPLTARRTEREARPLPAAPELGQWRRLALTSGGSESGGGGGGCLVSSPPPVWDSRLASGGATWSSDLYYMLPRERSDGLSSPPYLGRA